MHINTINGEELAAPLKKDRMEWLDFIRSIACIMVIILHVSAGYLYEHNPKSLQWTFFSGINSLTRSCVPLFFMVSGFVFIKIKDIQPKHFIRLIFCIIFYTFLCSIYISIAKDKSIVNTMLNAYRAPAIYHLWFFYSLFCCYSFFIFFSFKKRKVNITRLSCGLFLCFFLFSYTLYNQSNTIKNALNLNYIINSEGAYYILYSLLGAAIGAADTSAIKKKTLVFIFLFSSILISAFTVFVSIKKGYLISSFLLYNTFLVSLSAVSLFILVKNNQDISIKLKKYLLYISKLSLPVYGVHAIFVEALRYISITKFEIIDFFIKLAIVIMASLLCAIIIKKLDKKGYVS
ncbi:hypothetical protein ED28_05260 [[Pantoea] beijingensis]|uniref:Acyltransferase 3 domain-containing protein n=1 Tax=[Pantoea] beijingensis TaxID=1324864 RepID=A0A443IFY8_9GAMM|nr:hypothetical protein ED28_05260 [[Pantoea] beijingensis]